MATNRRILRRISQVTSGPYAPLLEQDICSARLRILSGSSPVAAAAALKNSVRSSAAPLDDITDLYWIASWAVDTIEYRCKMREFRVSSKPRKQSFLDDIRAILGS